MSIVKRLGILALVGAVLLVFGMLRPGAPAPTSDAAFWSPGGISALPSFFPAFPGVADQTVPAMIPASAPGNQALITAFADPGTGIFPDTGAVFDANCNVTTAGFIDFLGSVCFKVQALDLSTQALGPTAARFDASGADRLLCDDTATCDVNPFGGTISVLLNGGGKDEILTVTATDESGNTRTVDVITVQTMLALPPIQEPGQTPLAPGLQGISIVGYRCSDVGATLTSIPGVPPTVLFPNTLGDMWDAIYAGGAVTIGPLGQFYGCGQNTMGNPLDNLVQYQTDLGQLSLQPLLLGPSPLVSLAIPGFDCPIGKSVSVQDGSATPWNSVGLPPGPPWQMQNCDIDAAPNGTVGYLEVRTADVGVATITGQQGGVAASTLQTNVDFTGVATLALDLSGIPDTVAILGGGETLPVDIVVLSTAGGTGPSPVAGYTVACTVTPANAGFALLPDRDTTGADGIATIGLVPTGLPGTKFTISCSIVSHPEVAPVSKEVSLVQTPAEAELETVDLVEGCNPESSTWPDGTTAATIAGKVDPAEALSALWKFDPASGTWQGFSPTAPADVNNLASVNKLDVVFICVTEAAKWSRPTID